MDLESLLPPLVALCQEAGEAICGHYHAPGDAQVEAKADDSPLTRADIDSHRLLLAGLQQLSPRLPVLSEESPAATMAQRFDWARYWLVDPLDGTKEFIGRTGEFTINIALIVDHLPVLGLIYLPLKRLAYAGIPGRGAWLHDSERMHVLHCRALQPQRPVAVLASRRHRGERLQRCLDWLDSTWGPVERSNSGSALKFCQLAAGEGDFYPRYAPCCEWDVAAGQALVEAAGGAVLGLDGQPLRYNCRDSLLSPYFHAIAEPDNPLWQGLPG